MFENAELFEGEGLSYWMISKVKNQQSLSDTGVNAVFKGASALTACNKRKIADTWSTDSTSKSLSSRYIRCSTERRRKEREMKSERQTER